MERRRIIRYLRIAVTAFSLTACVLLVALWVRSYSIHDAIQGTLGVIERADLRVDMASWQGRLCVSLKSFARTAGQKWGWNATSAEDWELTLQRAAGWGPLTPPPNFVSFSTGPRKNGWVIWSPHWFLCALAATFAIAPWMHRIGWRFSLRTLLIAMTLVALALGTVIYFSG
jgi:hypothetical protein